MVCGWHGWIDGKDGWLMVVDDSFGWWMGGWWLVDVGVWWGYLFFVTILIERSLCKAICEERHQIQRIVIYEMHGRPSN